MPPPPSRKTLGFPTKIIKKKALNKPLGGLSNRRIIAPSKKSNKSPRRPAKSLAKLRPERWARQAPKSCLGCGADCSGHGPSAPSKQKKGAQKASSSPKTGSNSKRTSTSSQRMKRLTKLNFARESSGTPKRERQADSTQPGPDSNVTSIHLLPAFFSERSGLDETFPSPSTQPEPDTFPTRDDGFTLVEQPASTSKPKKRRITKHTAQNVDVQDGDVDERGSWVKPMNLTMVNGMPPIWCETRQELCET
jgi:hypothetical protein